MRDLQLVEAEDLAIWRHAAEPDLVIVSKDSDFHGLSLLYGHPPKTVWLRVGNAPTPDIAELLRRRQEAMRRFYEHPDAALLALA